MSDWARGKLAKILAGRGSWIGYSPGAISPGLCDDIADALHEAQRRGRIEGKRESIQLVMRGVCNLAPGCNDTECAALEAAAQDIEVALGEDGVSVIHGGQHYKYQAEEIEGLRSAARQAGCMYGGPTADVACQCPICCALTGRRVPGTLSEEE